MNTGDCFVALVIKAIWIILVFTKSAYMVTGYCLVIRAATSSASCREVVLTLRTELIDLLMFIPFFSVYCLNA